jgi:hypothetical protein
MFLTLHHASAAQTSTTYPMSPQSWAAAPLTGWVGKSTPSLKFARYEGMANGTMTLNDAVAVSNDAHFSNGTIEFDMKPLEYNDTGIIFRRQANDGGEFFYLRANPDCPAANDCIQYAPIVHSRMDWDIYPNYQGPAPIASSGWNHIRLIVAGQKMLVYINGRSEPTLIVPKLQGLTQGGGIAFKGPAIFANLVVSPNEAETLPDVHEPSPQPGTIINWLTTAPVTLPVGQPISPAAIPPETAWRKVAAEPFGLVNLSREFGTPGSAAASTAWLKTVVYADAPVKRTIHLGWKIQLTLFLNGAEAFSGENLYYPSDRRLSVDGRLDADNASIPVLLHAGRNEIVLAITNNWTTQAGQQKPSSYGWAAEARFDDTSQLKLN